MEIHFRISLETIKFVSIIYLCICLNSCTDNSINLLDDNPKYYIEGAMHNGSTLYFKTYKMWGLNEEPDYQFPQGVYVHQSDEIKDSIHLVLENKNTEKLYDTILSSPYTSYPFPFLKGKTGNSYSLHISIGKDSITSFFKIPDSFSVDTYSLSTEIDNEYLHFNIKFPPSYVKDSIVFHDPNYRYAGDIFWDFCKTEYPISAQTIINLGYLNWYFYAGCQIKTYYDNGDNRYKTWRLMQYFEPNSGQPISALTLHDYKYIRKLNEHVYKGLNGITQPVSFPSKFTSTVFYGGVIGYTNQIVKFKKP